MKTHIMLVSLLLPLASACGEDAEEAPADVVPSFDIQIPDFGAPPDVPIPTQDTGAAPENECGTGCPLGQVCAMCFESGSLTCVTPRAREDGSTCSTDEACLSGYCAIVDGGGRCARPCVMEEPAACGQPGETCLMGTTASGEERGLCLKAPCGSQGSVCSGADGCACDEGLGCIQLGGPFSTCEQTCPEDECPTGFECTEGQVCIPLGKRPGGTACEESAGCESNLCQQIGQVSVCLGLCNSCGLCPSLTNGCDERVTRCNELGVCVLMDETEAGAACFSTPGCLGQDVGGDGGDDGGEGSDGMDGMDGGEGQEGPDGGEGQDGPDGGEGQDGPDGGEGQDGPDGGEGQDGPDGGEGTDGPDGGEGAQKPAFAPGTSLVCADFNLQQLCAFSCDVQEDCGADEICRRATSIEGLEDNYCALILDGGVGDCCSVKEPCREDGADCVVDGDRSVCAPRCIADTGCPPGMMCRQAAVVGTGEGKHCVLNEPPAMPETCNNADDDLDGQIDEGAGGQPLQRPCYTGLGGTLGVGICKAGVQTCEQGRWSTCFGEKRPVPDGPDTQTGCDGFDNDCDGAIDEGCPCNGGIIPCGLEKGTCQKGVQVCVNKVLGSCDWGAPDSPTWPTPEICDGVDNDCDGGVDNQPGLPTEPLRLPCGALDPALDGVGACRQGTRTCDGECTGEVLPSEETCGDQIDNDCDGLLNEGCSCNNGERPCASGVGVCEEGVQVCEGGSWAAVCTGATGGGIEECDGLDNDCDGVVDNVFDTAVPLSQSCWSLKNDPEDLREGLGVCAPGLQSCYAGGFAACLGQVSPLNDSGAPAGDTCGDELDNDCDGAADEGCPCSPSGATRVCGSNDGACNQGEQACVGGVWSECSGGTMPAAEVCNDADDNCDGEVDDHPDGGSLSATCYEGDVGTLNVGLCVAGTALCAGGEFGACQDQVLPAVELCNDLDDDCDGIADDELGCGCDIDEIRSCGTATGACTVGKSRCTEGIWEPVCYGAIGPARETCNGLDDDCDGTTDREPAIDQALEEGCYTGPGLTAGIGQCARGSRVCAGGSWSSCLGQVLPVAEACDGADNDCDGLVDEGCDCTGASRPCGASAGACSPGTQACDGGTWADECAGAILPEAEVCDGLDNDCDGLTDNEDGGTLPVAEACYDADEAALEHAPCAAGLRYCRDGVIQGPCLGQVVPRIGDICGDGIDNDCDGSLEEDCD